MKPVPFSIIVGVGLLLLGAIVWIITARVHDAGDRTPIRGYDRLVKNLPESYKSAIEAALRDMIAYNGIDESQLDSVKDAITRKDSAAQEEELKDYRYTGRFIVDIESIGHSYQVQYEYSKRPEMNAQSGYPVLVGCLPKDQLIYGDFSCKERYTQTDEIVKDPIVSRLPRNTLSYSLIADATGKELILRAELRIPEIDLQGGSASRRQTVALYKKEVTEWITSQGLDPAKYTIYYNYLDNGNKRPARD